MSAAEKLGFTKETFDRLYDSCNGFDSRPNKNHPTYEENETLDEFLKKGSKKVVEDSRLMDSIIKAFQTKKGRVYMAIIEGTNSDGTKYYQYQQPDRKILRKRFNELLERLEELVKRLPELKFDIQDLAVNGRILGDIIVRVDKRSDYFLIFHEQTHISEIKKAALYAYWIIKLKPLSVVSPIIEKRIQYSYINETFALFILYGVLREKASRLNKEFSPSQEYTRKIAYAFKYWDISKEALILIAETLCEEYC